MGVIIPKLRQSARGQECAMMCVGICLRGTETTVLAHLPNTAKGMGNKGDDWHAVFACRACHDALDQHRLAPDDEWYYSIHALRITQKFWFENGYLGVVGDKGPKPKPPSSKTVPRRPMTVQPQRSETVTKLKPCPFCGGEAEWNLGKKGDDTPWRYIACSVCEAMGPHVEEWELSKTADDNDAVLIAAWNRRTALEETRHAD